MAELKFWGSVPSGLAPELAYKLHDSTGPSDLNWHVWRLGSGSPRHSDLHESDMTEANGWVPLAVVSDTLVSDVSDVLSAGISTDIPSGYWG